MGHALSLVGTSTEIGFGVLPNVETQRGIRGLAYDHGIDVAQYDWNVKFATCLRIPESMLVLNRSQVKPFVSDKLVFPVSC